MKVEEEEYIVDDNEFLEKEVKKIGKIKKTGMGLLDKGTTMSIFKLIGKASSRKLKSLKTDNQTKRLEYYENDNDDKYINAVVNSLEGEEKNYDMNLEWVLKKVGITSEVFNMSQEMLAGDPFAQMELIQ